MRYFFCWTENFIFRKLFVNFLRNLFCDSVSKFVGDVFNQEFLPVCYVSVGTFFHDEFIASVWINADTALFVLEGSVTGFKSEN